MNIYDIFNGKKRPKQSTVSESRIEIIHEFAEPEPGDSGESGVPEQVHQLANRWWNYADPEDQEKIEAVLRSLGWTISQVESEDDAVQLQYRDGSVEFISADEFDPDMHEDTDQFSSAGLNGVAATQDSDNVASPVGSGVEEGSNDGKEDNFTIDDIKNLEKIRDFETLKAHAKELIKGKPARRMKPEKISWFYNHIDTLKNPLAVIKMMYDLMLAGEGHKVIGSRNSMSSNSYRTKFGEQGVAEDTGSWIVYDPETKQIKKRFKTHTAGKSYARAHGLGFASSEYYFDTVKEPAVAEAQTDYQKRRARERDVDAGRPVKPVPKNPQTDYARKRAKEKRDLELFGEDDVDDFVKAGGKITYGKPQKGPRRPGLSLASRHIGGGGDKMKPSRTGRAGAAVGGKPVGIKEEQDTSGVEQAIIRRIMVAHTDLLKQFGPEKVMQAAEEVAYNVGDVDEIGTSDVSAYVNQVKQILGAEA